MERQSELQPHEPEFVRKNDVYALDGFMNSLDLVEKIAMLHKRQAHVKELKFEQDDKLQEMNLAGVEKEDTKRQVVIKVVNSLIRESSTINSRLKEYSLLYRSAIDQIMIEELRKYDYELYETLLSKSKIIYSSKNKAK